MSNGRGSQVYFDLRCLQDGHYQYRGVGFHVASLLRGANARKHELIGLVDPSFPTLPAEYASLVDRVSLCWNPPVAGDALFVSASPMTHDPTRCMRFFSHPRVSTAAVIYDFIPLDRGGYLPLVSHQIDYFTKLAYLKNIDSFLPISEYSAKRLKEVLGVSSRSISVTGASVRQSLYEAADSQEFPAFETSSQTAHKYFLTVGGGDRRKNTEVAVQAVWLLRLLVDEPITLKIVGHYGPDYAADLTALATNGGSASFVEFCSGVSDAELVRLYAGAVATIAPSHIEGFSLPVVEAAVCGSPVVASICAAHLELIDNPAALFPSTEANVLCGKLHDLLSSPNLRRTLIQQQHSLAERFHEETVANRFWSFLSPHINPAAPTLLQGIRPKIAFVTPYPPDESGVARFSERTLEAAAKYMDIDLYTDADRPIDVPEGIADAGNVDPALLRRGPYDSIVSVLGNSHFHLGMFNIMEQFGGPCIMHDSRLVHIYYRRLGRARFSEWAEQLLKRPVAGDEIDRWLHDQDLASLFIEPILERAEPLIVHTARYQQLIRERYGHDAALTTFPPNLNFSEQEISSNSRAAARARLGISDKLFAVASFGYVSGSKGIASLIVALNILRSWRFPAELFLVGSDVNAIGLAQEIAAVFGVTDQIHTNTEFVSHERYRDYMLGVDAAVQLRTYDYGQPSAGLADCISAGLPTVANRSLSLSCDGPSYVTQIPDHISPLLIAEALAAISGVRTEHQQQISEERRCYLDSHNFDVYARKLTHILGFA